MKKRTEIRFATNPAQWSVIDQWAASENYRPQNSTVSERLYKKGTGFLVAPTMLHFSQAGGETVMQVWIHSTLLVRAFALFLLPEEMGLESGGIAGALPRKLSRNAVNTLLAQLRIPAIA